MDKRVGALLLSGLIASSLYGAEITESQKFIGVDIAVTEVQGDGPSEFSKNLSNGTSFGFHVGAENEKWRTTVGLQYFDAEGRNVEKLYGLIDYFFLSNQMTDSLIIKPYMGINIGYANYESNEFDGNGFLYGGQGGVVLDLTEELTLDASYRYSLSSALVFDHSQDIVFGFNYKY